MNAKPTALAAYLARTAAIHAKLERLESLADDHFGYDPDAIHWDHVGELERFSWSAGSSGFSMLSKILGIRFSPHFISAAGSSQSRSGVSSDSPIQ